MNAQGLTRQTDGNDDPRANSPSAAIRLAT
jgi:hypothetical protein